MDVPVYACVSGERIMPEGLCLYVAWLCEHIRAYLLFDLISIVPFLPIL
jgi:hypothetical protein